MDHRGKTCNIQRKYQMLYLSNRKLSNSMRNRDLEDYLNNKKKINATAIDIELWNAAMVAVQVSLS